MDTYYKPEHLPRFGEIAEGNKELADAFFAYYGKVFKDGALSAREKALIALAVVTIAVQLDRQTRRTPELAVAVPELVRSSAQTRIAALALAGEDPDEALAEAERLVRRRPLPAEHLRVLAQAQFAAGEIDQSALTIQYAARRGWRDPLAQETMLRLALDAGDEAEAARRFVALFLRRDAMDALLEEVGPALLDDPGGEGRRTMTAMLVGGVRWHNQFFARGMRVIPSDAFAEIVVEASRQGTRFDCKTLRNVSERLKGRDEAAGEAIAEAAQRHC